MHGRLRRRAPREAGGPTAERRGAPGPAEDRAEDRELQEARAEHGPAVQRAGLEMAGQRARAAEP